MDREEKIKFGKYYFLYSSDNVILKVEFVLEDSIFEIFYSRWMILIEC